jgi:hypothetical protein
MSVRQKVNTSGALSAGSVGRVEQVVSLAELDALIAERIEAESPRTHQQADAEHARILASLEPAEPQRQPES